MYTSILDSSRFWGINLRMIKNKENLCMSKRLWDQKNFVSALTNLGTEFIITVPAIAQSGKVNWGHALNLQPPGRSQHPWHFSSTQYQSASTEYLLIPGTQVGSAEWQWWIRVGLYLCQEAVWGSGYNPDIDLGRCYPYYLCELGSINYLCLFLIYKKRGEQMR